MPASSKIAELYLELSVKGSQEVQKYLEAVRKELLATNDAAKDLEKRNLGVMHHAMALGNQGMGIMGTVGMMSSMAGGGVFDTFKASFEELFAVIGTSFTPALLEVSKIVQDAADWFMNLDPVLKRIGGSVVVWTGAGLVLIGVVGRIASTLWTVVSANGAFIASLFTMKGAMGIIGVGIGVLIARWIAGSDSVTQAMDRMLETTDRARSISDRLETGGSVTPREVLESRALSASLRGRLEGASADERRRILREEADRAAGGGPGTLTVHGSRLPSGEHGTTSISSRPAGMSLEDWTRHTTAAFERSRILRALADAPELLGRVLTGDPRTSALRTNFRFNAQFHSVENQWRRHMQAAGSLTPHEAFMQEIALKQLAEMMRVAGNLEGARALLEGLRPGMAE